METLNLPIWIAVQVRLKNKKINQTIVLILYKIFDNIFNKKIKKIV